MTRVVFLAAVILIVLPFFASGSGAYSVVCNPAALRLRLMSEGTATQSVIFLRADGFAAAGCAATGPVSFSIRHRGAFAPVLHNPIATTARAAESWPNGIDVAHVWWANWCGARTQITIQATYRGRRVTLHPRVLPTCIQPKRRSFLALPA